jgi:hypothetical protein
MLLLAWIAACAPNEVDVTGVVYDGPGSATRESAGTVRLLDADAQEYDHAAVGADGSFSVSAPLGSDIYAVVEADGSPATAFAGISGINDFEAEPGSIFAFPGLTDWLEPFAGCPGLDSGGMVVGEVRFSDLRDPDSGLQSIAAAAKVLVAVDGKESDLVDACYLTDDGTAWSPDAPLVGLTGRFAIGGLPEGIHELRVGIQTTDAGFDYSFYPVWVPGDGVAPQFPAYVDFLD